MWAFPLFKRFFLLILYNGGFICRNKQPFQREKARIFINPLKSSPREFFTFKIIIFLVCVLFFNSFIYSFEIDAEKVEKLKWYALFIWKFQNFYIGKELTSFRNDKISYYYFDYVHFHI